MSPYTRVVQSIIRLIAFGLVILGVCLGAGDLFLYLSHRPVSSPGSLLLKALPFLAGFVLFWKSSAMAVHFTKDLD